MKKKLSLLCGGALLLNMLCASPVHAQPVSPNFKEEQYGLFYLGYLTEKAYKDDVMAGGVSANDVPAFDSSFKSGELKMLPTGFDYWSAMLEPYAEGTADLDIALLRARDDNASAQSEFVEEGIFAGQTELTATLKG